MTFTIHFTWWMIPLVITLLVNGWAMFWPAGSENYSGNFPLPDFTPIFRLIPALLLTAVVWVIAAFVK